MVQCKTAVLYGLAIVSATHVIQMLQCSVTSSSHIGNLRYVEPQTVGRQRHLEHSKE